MIAEVAARCVAGVGAKPHLSVLDYDGEAVGSLRHQLEELGLEVGKLQTLVDEPADCP
jgi:hypothetical protein